MRSKYRILIPSTIIALAIAAMIAGPMTPQFLPHQAAAQGAPSLLAGDLTAPSNGKPFGGQKIGSYAVTPEGQRVDIHIHVDKHPTAGKVLAAWLVDTKANYSLSLGQVEADIDPPSLTFSQTMVNPYIYDQLIVTEEPEKDTNPNPSQPIGGTALEAPFGA